MDPEIRMTEGVDRDVPCTSSERHSRTAKGTRLMATGTVKWFNLDKGYGFISPDDGSPDLFVHFTNIDHPNSRNLLEGQPVDFEIGEGQKGPQALHVSTLGDPPADYQPASRPQYGPSYDRPKSHRPRQGLSSGRKPPRRG